MSAETLQYHHDKHHKAYVDNLNKLLPGSGFEGKSLEEIVKASYGKNPGMFNNAGQDFNHNPFLAVDEEGRRRQESAWLGARADRPRPRRLRQVPQRLHRGRQDPVRLRLGWLTLKDGKLEVTKTPNGENPLVHGGWPLLGVDVWEHSYYIDYRNSGRNISRPGSTI